MNAIATAWPARFLAVIVLGLAAALRAEDVSPPAILQYFEGTYNTIEDRVPDIFRAGYGAVYTPPPGRADQGNFSVGYDPYDRFDLGKPGNFTLYGSETGLKTAVKYTHAAGLDFYLDFVLNHNGYSDLGARDGNGVGFYDAGGYPGLCISLPEAIDGDFHSAFEGGDKNGRLAGLIDINHGTNFRFFRSPVPGLQPGADHGGNIRAGTQSAFGRIANLPDESNRRFYPDQSLPAIFVFDPKTNESNIAVYPYNLGSPLAGDPVPENAMGYLMRNAQWLAQAIGVDGFRIDAAKHVEGYVLDFFDRAVYRASFRGMLDGSQKQIFSFCETYDGNKGYLQTFVVKSINPGDPGRIGGNRDTLDFSLFFPLRENLSGNGFQNSWFNIRDAALDLNDDGLHNGSQGVMFVQSHDEPGPALGNVAHAYVLMHPGNAVVYFNAHEFGDSQARNFPKDGRGDALGGLYGNAIPGLVDIRNRYGRGDYIERWIEKENFAYERSNSCVVLLSNRVDGGFDSRTLATNFDPGTPLIELTGNAASNFSDPFDNIPELVEVNGDRTINVNFLRNAAPGTNNFTGNGYLIYGPSAPQGSLSISNVAQTIPGGTPATATNGTTRISDIKVIQSDSFQVTLQTNAVNLLGVRRDQDADGDNALLRIDEGVDANGNGQVDFRTPGTPSYAFEEFQTVHSPGYFNGSGDGTYSQTVSATAAGLSEGMHFITVRAFRHRPNGGPAIFIDFKQSIYLDRLPPVSAIDSFNPIVAGINENRQLRVRSTDLTANSVHTFLDLPAALSDSAILSMVNGGSQSGRIDRDLFAHSFGSLAHGNHVFTVVTYERTGRVNVQRFPGQFTSTIIGAGLGDVNTNGAYEPADIDLFRTLLFSNNTQFHPAADLNGDGLINDLDLNLLGTRLDDVNADQPTHDAYNQLLIDAGQFNYPPVANADSKSTPENMALLFAASDLTANDTPGPAGESAQTLTVTSVDAISAQGGIVSLSGGTITYTPPAGYEGGDAFGYTVTDNGTPSKSATAAVSVTVSAVNDPPMALDGTLNTGEDSPASGTLAASDPEDDALTFSIVVNGNIGAAVITNAATGAFIYTPNANATGSDTITFQASDGILNSNIATLSVNIGAINDPPVAVDQLYTTDEDTPLTGSLSASDAENDPRTYILLQNGAQGTAMITDAATGAFTYTPYANVTGTDTFTFKANDGASDSNTATITVVIRPVNDAPLASNGTVSTNEDTAISGVLIGSDVDTNSLSYSIVAQSTQGSVVITDAVTGAFTYTPNANVSGADSFTFKVSDGVLESAAATVVIEIGAVNDSPTISSQPSAEPNPAIAGESVSFSVTTADVDGDTPTFTWAFGDGVSATGGSVAHVYGAAGTYTASVTVSDGQGGSAAASVSVTVNAAPPGPLDTDGDGISDDADPDDDNDGFSDAEELAAGTQQDNAVSNPGPFGDIDGDGQANDVDSDDDGDGFSDEIEVALGTSSFNSASTPTGGAAVSPQPLVITKLSISLDFIHPGRDSISVRGVLPVAAGFSPLGQEVVLDAGGVVRRFVLNGKGKSPRDLSSLRVQIKSRKGAVVAQQAKFSATLRKGDFDAFFVDENLVPATLKNASRFIRVTVLFDRQIFVKDQPQKYTATMARGKTLSQ